MLKLNNKKIMALAPGASMLYTSGAEASGFHLREQSVGAQGEAMAGVGAGNSDISYMFFNPASLTYMEEKAQSQLDVSYLIGKTKAKAGRAASKTGAELTTGNREERNLLDDTLIPAAYFAGKLSDNLYAGLSVNVPFGFKTEYESTWIGRYHGVESDIRTANIAFNLATKVNDKFSIGGGFQVEYVDALLSQAVDFGTIAGAPVPGTDDGFAKVNGDDWGFGYSLGGIYEIKDNLRVGLGYRSRIDHKIEGTTEFERSATGQALAKAKGAFLTSDAFVNFSTPSQFYLGARWDMNEKWALLGEVDRTNWSIFDVLKIQYSNPNQPAAITDERWTDVYFISMGTEYKYDDKTTLSAGIAFDETPVREAYRTPRIPGADRLWLTFGLDYEYNEKIDISFGYTHIFMDNIKVDLSHNDAGSANRGDLQVNYEGSMDIIGLQANYKF